MHVSYNDTLRTILPLSTIKGLRQNYYQLCNEFGWFIPTRGYGPLGVMNDEAFYTKLCQDAFDIQYNTEYIKQKIRATNLRYGDFNANITNIYVTEGDLNPWKYLGLPSAHTIPRK